MFLNYGKHYDFCHAHPVRSFLYMIAVCFVAITAGHYLHIPRPIYVAAAVVTYYRMTGGGW